MNFKNVVKFANYFTNFKTRSYEFSVNFNYAHLRTHMHHYECINAACDLTALGRRLPDVGPEQLPRYSRADYPAFERLAARFRHR